jgi:hypothetical protein
MQKKKPSFQVIPNYRISGLTNWNESKEVPAEQGWNDTGLRSLSNRRRPILYGNGHPNYRGDIAT